MKQLCEKLPLSFSSPFNSLSKIAFNWERFLSMLYKIKVCCMSKQRILSFVTPSLFARTWMKNTLQDPIWGNKFPHTNCICVIKTSNDCTKGLFNSENSESKLIAYLSSLFLNILDENCNLHSSSYLKSSISSINNLSIKKF